MARKEYQNSATKSVINPNVIIKRALPLLSSVLATELSQLVTSLFQANVNIRLATDKSKLMQQNTERFPKQTITVWTVVPTVLTAISQSNGNGQTLTIHRIQTP